MKPIHPSVMQAVHTLHQLPAETAFQISNTLSEYFAGRAIEFNNAVWDSDCSAGFLDRKSNECAEKIERLLSEQTLTRSQSTLTVPAGDKNSGTLQGEKDNMFGNRSLESALERPLPSAGGGVNSITGDSSLGCKSLVLDGDPLRKGDCSWREPEPPNKLDGSIPSHEVWNSQPIPEEESFSSPHTTAPPVDNPPDSPTDSTPVTPDLPCVGGGSGSSFLDAVDEFVGGFVENRVGPKKEGDGSWPDVFNTCPECGEPTTNQLLCSKCEFAWERSKPRWLTDDLECGHFDPYTDAMWGSEELEYGLCKVCAEKPEVGCYGILDNCARRPDWAEWNRNE